MNYKNSNVFFVFVILYSLQLIGKDNNTSYAAVTYSLNGGRLGDNLRSYSYAYWLAHTYNIPFLFTPFTYSEHMRMHHVHTHYTPACDEMYTHKKVLKKHEQFNMHDKRLKNFDDTLLVTTFYCKTGVDWKDTAFVARMRELIAPHGEWDYMPLPADKSTIAIHMRRGGGYSVDTNACRRKRPLHFPHIEFYQKALQVLLARYSDEAWYVYVFTDDQNPEGLVAMLCNGLTSEEQKRIVIECRAAGNRHNANVLEDFFDMMCFDYLIRPNSMMSTFAERLGKHKLVVHPHKGHRGHPWGNVTEIEIRDYTGEKCLKEYVAL